LRTRPTTHFKAGRVEVFDPNERKEEAVEQGVAGWRAWLDAVEVGGLDASEIEEASDVATRGMRDNPLIVAVFGDDPDQRYVLRSADTLLWFWVVWTGAFCELLRV
jgi:hypothetical protein